MAFETLTRYLNERAAHGSEDERELAERVSNFFLSLDEDPDWKDLPEEIIKKPGDEVFYDLENPPTAVVLKKGGETKITVKAQPGYKVGGWVDCQGIKRSLTRFKQESDGKTHKVLGVSVDNGGYVTFTIHITNPNIKSAKLTIYLEKEYSYERDKFFESDCVLVD